MPLQAGTRLGPYEIHSALGAGGMGEVYRARDTRLGRDIALKVVSESFTHEPERLARFRRDPAWARNGRELFYRDAAGALITVPIQTQPAFSAGNPAKLFDANYAAAGTGRSYDVSPDGKRFLFIKNNPAPTSTGAQASPSLVVVQGWFEELKRLVPIN